MELSNYLLKAAKRFVSYYWNLQVNSSQSQKFSASNLSEILINWDIGKIRSKRILRGGSSSNWIVKTSSGKYVLRNAGKNREYIEFQIFVMNKLHDGGFPYSTPQPIETDSGAYCVPYQGYYWLLYRFIEGTALQAASNKSKDIGQLVASYHKVAQGIDYSSVGDFSLALFETEKIISVFQESVNLIAREKSRNKLEDLLIKTTPSILEAYNNIPLADKESIENSEKIPIYNDWHGYNILRTNEQIIGLIDFDSLVISPRIVDVQNALLYATGTDKGIDMAKMQAFIQGYSSVMPLSKSELSLIHSLMIDRVASIMSDILAEKNTNDTPYKDDILVFLINVLNWTVHNKENFVKNLFAAIPNSS